MKSGNQKGSRASALRACPRRSCGKRGHIDRLILFPLSMREIKRGNLSPAVSDRFSPPGGDEGGLLAPPVWKASPLRQRKGGSAPEPSGERASLSRDQPAARIIRHPVTGAGAAPPIFFGRIERRRRAGRLLPTDGPYALRRANHERETARPLPGKRRARRQDLGKSKKRSQDAEETDAGKAPCLSLIVFKTEHRQRPSLPSATRRGFTWNRNEGAAGVVTQAF